MTKDTHTAGPWVYVEERLGHSIKVSGDENGGCIADVYEFYPEYEANARLIAASPDLLEALERTLNFIANTESEMGEQLECGDMARAAIAKARGQS